MTKNRNNNEDQDTQDPDTLDNAVQDRNSDTPNDIAKKTKKTLIVQRGSDGKPNGPTHIITFDDDTDKYVAHVIEETKSKCNLSENSIPIIELNGEKLKVNKSLSEIANGSLLLISEEKTNEKDETKLKERLTEIKSEAKDNHSSTY